MLRPRYEKSYLTAPPDLKNHEESQSADVPTEDGSVQISGSALDSYRVG